MTLNSARRWCTVSVVVLLAGIAACGGVGNSTPPPAPAATRGELLTDTFSASVGITNINLAIAALMALGVDTSAFTGKYGVMLRRISYRTVTPDGRLIAASGVVAWPLKLSGVPSPMLSFQHATLFRDSDAPSNNASSGQVLLAIAGTGYIVMMPDYIGYGASANEVHPYVHAQGLAASIVDMVRATRQLLARHHIASNGQLFLTGYSEGGYATLAAQKEMEQNLAEEFPLTASMAAAGPYDMSATTQYIVGLAINANPAITGFVFKAYDHWHQWNRLNAIFRSPYNTVVATYYDGTHSSSGISAALTSASADLFTTSFRTAFLGTGEATVKNGFAANDIYNWAPRTPTRLFHGVDDSIVPYFNARTARAAMNLAGATDLALIDCITPPFIPRGHEECVPDYLGRVTSWFGTLAANL
jgi:pimeloyl-ACP methyl ester carboxylesterase